MRAAVISLGSTSSSWIVESLRKYFDQVDDLSIKDIETNFSGEKLEVLYKGKELKDYDCIYAKGSFRHEQLLRSVAEALYSKCYMPITPDAFTIGHDKILTHLMLQRKGIAMPKTFLAASIKSGKKILESATYPVVMKFPKGTQGKGVMFADSFASASSLLDALEVLKQPLLIQEYIDTDGVDIRALVVGNQVVAAMRRKSVKGEKRSNIHAGGEGESYSIDPKIEKIAVDSAKAVGAEICGVDILESRKGPLVIEINLSPGLQGITKATKLDIAAKIAEYLYKRAKQQKEKGKSDVLEELGIAVQKSNIKGLITQISMRGERILLPELATKISKITEKDEVSLTVEKGKISVQKI